MPESAVEISAPISVNGSATLRIGRLIKDSSPVNLAFNPRPDINPDKSLIPVPELPRSIRSSMLLKASAEVNTFTFVFDISILAPI